jgi:hypothetical protein
MWLFDCLQHRFIKRIAIVYNPLDSSREGWPGRQRQTIALASVISGRIAYQESPSHHIGDQYSESNIRDRHRIIGNRQPWQDFRESVHKSPCLNWGDPTKNSGIAEFLKYCACRGFEFVPQRPSKHQECYRRPIPRVQYLETWAPLQIGSPLRGRGLS